MRLEGGEVAMAELNKALRQGWNQSEIAAKCGVSKSSLCHALAGRKPVPDRVLDWLGLERVAVIRRRASVAESQ